MTDHFQRVQELFEQLRSCEPEQRDALLDEACCGDSALRAEIDTLLTRREEINDPPGPADPESDDATPCHAPPDSMIGSRIGAFTITDILGRGGQSVVYLATQSHPHRTVALKVMNRSVRGRSDVRRFKFETEILARLRHPNIAHIYEAGAHDDGSGGAPYFAMEYIPEHQTLTEYAVAQKLSVHDRLRLFLKVCAAVHHGHQNGVIHRDLKPGNILIGAAVDAPEPKVIDFGVARSTNSDLAVTTMHTDVGRIIGTLAYMSPEQLGGNSHDVDTRSDVYTLGVLLYELLCGVLPHDVSDTSLPDAVRRISERQPPRMSVINRTVRGDLETITMKAMARDPQRRYPSAADLLQDIERYLKHEPISARPPSTAYIARMFIKRNTTLVAALASIFLLLAAATIVSATLWRRSETHRTEAMMIFHTIDMYLKQDAHRQTDHGVTIQRLPPDPHSSRSARTILLTRDLRVGVRGLDIRTLVAMSDDDPDTLECLDATLKIPPAADRVHRTAIHPNVASVMMEDVLPDRPGVEMTAVIRNAHFSTSVVRIQDPYGPLNPDTPCAEWWHDGHLRSVFRHQATGRIVCGGVSNMLAQHVPSLNNYNLIKRSPDVICVIDPAHALPHAVLFPLEGDTRYPLDPSTVVLVRVPDVAWEHETGNERLIQLYAITPPTIDDPEALCMITVQYVTVHSENTLNRRFDGHINDHGQLITPLVCRWSDDPNDDRIGQTAESIGVPPIRFERVDAARWAAAREVLNQFKGDAWTIDGLHDAIAKLSQPIGPESGPHDRRADAIALAQRRLDDPGWLIDQAWDVLWRDPQHDDQRATPITELDYARARSFLAYVQRQTLLPKDDAFVRFAQAVVDFRLGAYDQARAAMHELDVAYSLRVLPHYLALFAMCEHHCAHEHRPRMLALLSTRLKLSVDQQANYNNDWIAQSLVAEYERLTGETID